jgi:peptide deformylase
MIRPILLYGDEMLREISVNVNRASLLEVRSLISELFETMHRANGIGLAAIQIGIPLRIFVIEAHIESENFHFRESFINPVIIREFGNPVKHPEGCLSVPGLTALVERPSSIEIEWYNENWIQQRREFSGIAARIIQHEYDHLEGIFYTDKIDKMWMEAIKPSLEIIENREMEVPYLCK